MKQKLKYLLILAVFVLCMYKPFSSEAKVGTNASGVQYDDYDFIVENTGDTTFTPPYYPYKLIIRSNYDKGDDYVRMKPTGGNISLSSSRTDYSSTGNMHYYTWYYYYIPNAGTSGTIVFTRNPKVNVWQAPDKVTVTINKNQSACSHTYGAWQSDANNHWRTCTVCGYKQGPSAHTKSGNSCSTCGRVMHTHNSSGKSGYKAPTCTTAGGYYPACSADGTVTGSWVSVPATGHS